MFEKYIKEFERLYIACDCRDQEEQKIAKFVLGLTKNLRNFVELQPLTTFDEVCSLACKMEKQHKGYRFGGFKIINPKLKILLHLRKVIVQKQLHKKLWMF